MSYKHKPFTVRVIYVMPRDVEPWREAKRRAHEWLEDIQWFFADQMEKLDHGPKTFEIATDTRGELVFHQIKTSIPEEEFRESKDFVKNCNKVAKDNGLVSSNDIIVYFCESYSLRNGKVSAVRCQGLEKERRGVPEQFASQDGKKRVDRQRKWIRRRGFRVDQFRTDEG